MVGVSLIFSENLAIEELKTFNCKQTLTSLVAHSTERLFAPKKPVILL